MVKRRVGDLLVGQDNSVWLYKSLPLAAVTDAKDPDAVADAVAPVMDVFDQLAELSVARFGRRRTDKGGYREFHLLMVNVPRPFTPPAGHGNAAYLSECFPTETVAGRMALLGVRLRDRVGSGGSVRDVVDSVVMTFTVGGAPLEDYAADRRGVDAAMARAGLRPVTTEQFGLAESWWNAGTSYAGPYLPHPDHVHMYSTVAAAASAAQVQRRDADCARWPHLPQEHLLSFSSVAGFDTGFVDAADRSAQWAARLLGEGVVAVSVRGLVEPARNTRAELRRHKRNYEADIRERAHQGKMERAEQQEMLDNLSHIEGYYARDEASPTLTDVSVTVAGSGRHARTGFDPAEMGQRAKLLLVPMAFRQEAALLDCMLASRVRANPHLHDIPSQTLAYSGITSLSRVGDRPRGALVGFCETDRQPVWLDHMAATDADTPPIFAVVGQSGSGKSVLMMWLAAQYARLRNDPGTLTPVVVIDPSPGSDFSGFVTSVGGRCHSLDDLTHADGVFDALRFSQTPADGIEMAHLTLMSANPWGTDKTRFEAPLMQALSYGVAQGATCIGRALEAAAAAPAAAGLSRSVPDLLQGVREMHAGSAKFRAVCGFDDSGEPLSVSGGITYIRFGNASVSLPQDGRSLDRCDFDTRITATLLKAMVYGSMMACAFRQGVVFFDEGWVVLSGGRAEMDRLGRLARKLQVFPGIFTQRVVDAQRAELTNFISRLLILPIEDRDEATAALALARLDPTTRLARVTAKSSVGDTDDGAGAPNWASMRALRHEPSGRTLRGAVGILCDLSDRAVPVEITIPEPVLAAISTNRLDRLAREAAPPTPTGQRPPAGS